MTTPANPTANPTANPPADPTADLSTPAGSWTPSVLLRRVAIAEAITWAGLLGGMFLKYGTETTDLGVRVFGMIHGVVFLGYLLTTLVVALDQRWRAGRTLVALAASIPPFCTVLLEWWAGRHGWFAPSWRLREQDPSSLRSGTDRALAPLIRNPARGLWIGVAAVAVLTVLVLVLKPLLMG